MEKQYKPSKKRLEKARKEGNVSKSQYLSQSCGLLIGLLVCLFYLSNSWVEHKILIEYLWTQGFKEPEQAVSVIASKYLYLTLKLLLIVSVVNITVEILQVGLFLEPGLLALKLDKLNPASGFKKMFENFKNSWLVVLRFIIIASALSWFFYALLGKSEGVLYLPSYLAGKMLYGLVLELSALLGSLLIILAILDYYIQRRKWFKNVGMSLQDMRQENKDDEGDPLVKSLRKHQHRELLQQDLVRRIRAARVVIVERAS